MKKLLLLFIPLVLFSCSTGVSDAEIEKLEKKIGELEERLKQNAPSRDEWDADNIAYTDFTGEGITQTVTYFPTKVSEGTGIIGSYNYDNTVRYSMSNYSYTRERTIEDFKFFDNGFYDIYYKYTMENVLQDNNRNDVSSTIIEENSFRKQGRFKIYKYTENIGIVELFVYDTYNIFDSAYYYFNLYGELRLCKYR